MLTKRPCAHFHDSIISLVRPVNKSITVHTSESCLPIVPHAPSSNWHLTSIARLHARTYNLNAHVSFSLPFNIGCAPVCDSVIDKVIKLASALYLLPHCRAYPTISTSSEMRGITRYDILRTQHLIIISLQIRFQISVMKLAHKLTPLDQKYSRLLASHK